MKVILASVSFTTPYTPQRRFLALGYIHANAAMDAFVGPRAEIVHNYYDPSTRSAEQLAAEIVGESPDLVAFTCYVWNCPDVLRICEQVKRMRPACRILLGGPEVSYKHTSILDTHRQVDWIAVNEGEETFREFMIAWLNRDEQALAALPGLAQRKPDGTSYVPSPRPYLKELDRLPSPYLSGVLDVCDIRHGANYQTARGCPFVCSYCDYGRNQPYYEFSLERVRAEFEVLKAQGARILFNVDPTFNYSRKRAEAILALMQEMGINAIHWFEVFPSLINEDLIDLVDSSFLSFMGVGIQSCNPVTMKNIHRVWKPEKIAPMIDRLRYRKNIMLSAEIIMGLPGDGVQDYMNTMSWTYSRQPADIKSFNLAILPRTPLEKEVEKWGIEYNEDVGHEILRTDFMSPQDVLLGKAINDWHRMLQKLFFLLTKVTGLPAGELIKDWAWCVFNAGYHDRIPELQVHRIGSDLVEPLAEIWERFVADQCATAGVPDVSLPLREEIRYHFYRRSRTWVSAFFADVRDIYFNEPYPELHRYFKVQLGSSLPQPVEGAASAVPCLGGDIDSHSFGYDMHDLYALADAASLAAVEPRETTYVMFMAPDTGAGCGIIVDDASRTFLELVDGRRSVADIGRGMGDVLGPQAAAAAPAIYTALAATGIFARPRFLTSFEDGKATWQSAFPEVYRAYH